MNRILLKPTRVIRDVPTLICVGIGEIPRGRNPLASKRVRVNSRARFEVLRLAPRRWATSSAFRPASICLTAAIICASECLLLDILPHLPECENRTRFCVENRDQARPRRSSRFRGSTRPAPRPPEESGRPPVRGSAGGIRRSPGHTPRARCPQLRATV